MENKKQTYGLDPLTKIRTEDAAKAQVETYLQDCGQYKGDAFFLLHLKNWENVRKEYGTEMANSILQQIAFTANRLLRKTDVFARIGEQTFLLYILGCGARDEAEKWAYKFAQQINTLRFFQEQDFQLNLQIGGVLCQKKMPGYESLKDRAGRAVMKADCCSDKNIYIDDVEGTLGDTAHQSLEITEITSYEAWGNQADMKFITELIDTLIFCGNAELGIEMALERLGNYFRTDQAYVVELTTDRKYLEISYQWDAEEPLVVNENLWNMSCLLIKNYQELFDERGIFSCNSLDEMEKKHRIMAERQRIRGSKAVMQSILQETDSFVGYICLADLKEERLWTSQELATFSMASKLLASDILQVRSLKYRHKIIYSDSLTGAWNFNKFLIEAEKRWKNIKLNKAVIVFDIKNFRQINEEQGYDIGNRVLVEISNALRFFIENGECYARSENDNFVLLLGYETTSELQQRIEQLLDRVERVAGKMELLSPLVCMAGVCLEEPEKTDLRKMIERAGLVKKTIKNYHKSKFVFFSKEVEVRQKRETYFTVRMQEALKNEEFLIYYQPKVDVLTQKYVGLEALVRWKSYDGELVAPGEFIPLFESNGFISELDLYVFEHVCQLIATWIDEKKQPYPVAVNISRIHVKEATFLENLEAICRKYQVPAEFIELELTESAFLDNPSSILEVARGVKEKGFKLSMDDFGTGYSSLSMLKDIPVDILKLDKEFFQINMSEREKIIISNIIRLAADLKIQVISEGIETKEQEQFLKEIGCRMAQGYLYAKPAPIEQQADALWGKKEKDT